MADEPMSKEEFHSIREELGWSITQLAVSAKRDLSLTKKMASGSRSVDDNLAQWMRRVRSVAAELRRAVINRGQRPIPEPLQAQFTRLLTDGAGALPLSYVESENERRRRRLRDVVDSYRND